MSPSIDIDILSGHSQPTTTETTTHAATVPADLDVASDTTTTTTPKMNATPIAICGMGVRLPSGIRSPSDLFNFLLNKGDARNVVPSDRYNVDAYYDPSGKPGTIKTKYGYYLDVDLAQFDATMFGMSKTELTTLDPSQRLLLEVTREAFESAGEPGFRGSNTGTFVGDFTEDWQDVQNIDLLNHQPYLMLGKSDFSLANRLAFEYDLVGPSVVTKTACSATAEALHQAVLAIRSGSCPSAIVAGANVIITPRTSISMSQLGLLAPDGNCKTFDSSANGFARGESVCAIYLKRLEDAIRDGNPIRAVIRACESNADGGDGTRTFGTPNPKSQEKLIRHAYASAGLPLDETKVVELHGTGTVVGDPLEASAIASCFGGVEQVYIGSVKPNLGHGEGASALSSIIKAVMALENKTVLPNIKFNTPNPKSKLPFVLSWDIANLLVPWDQNLVVPVEPTQWPRGARERISMNSFGLGGSNVHVVLDSADSMGIPSRPFRHTIADRLPTHKSLLLLSGNSAPAITELASKYGEYLEKNPANLDAMVYTLAARRERLKLGSYCIADGLMVGEPVTPAESKGVRQVAFIFTGQGAQWVGMGREMLKENAEFAASIEEMDKTLQSIDHPPSWSLEGLLTAEPSEKDMFSATDISQPICAAIQMAYVDALAAWNIKPSAVVGHSSGEVASAYAAGVLNRKEAIIAAYYRGYACARCEIPGAMAAVGLGRDDVEQHLKSGVVLACENSNASVTISGDLTAVEGTIESLKQADPNVFVRRLRVPVAYHSHHIKTIGGLYKSLVAPYISPKAPTVPFYSTVYGRQVRESKALGAEYWQLNIENPVLFRTAVSQMLADMNDTAHLEIGPHSALAGPLRQIYKETGSIQTPYTSVAERGQDAAHVFLSAIGTLFTFGIIPTPPASEQAYTLPDLPTYAWNYANRYWSETRVMAGWRFREHARHEILGQRILESSDVEPSWRNLIRVRDVPWLSGHCVEKDIIFPAAGCIAIAGTAIGQLTGSAAYTVQNVHIASAMILEESKSVEVVTTLRKHALTAADNSRWWEFTISSENKGIWTKHCWGLVTEGCAVSTPSNPDVAPLARRVDSKRWYQTLSRAGLNYSDRFVGLQDITASPVDLLASAVIPDIQVPGEEYALHPSTLDNVLQSWSIAATNGEYRRLDHMFLPTFIEQFYVSDSGRQSPLRVRTTAKESVVQAEGDSYGLTAESQVAFVLNGFHASRMGGSFRQEPPKTNAWSVQWHPAIDLATLDTLIRPTGEMTDSVALAEQVCLLCAMEIDETAASIPVASLAKPFLKNYLDGIRKQLELIDQGLSKVPGALELKTLGTNRETRLRKLDELVQQGKGGPSEVSISALCRAATNIEPVLKGQQSYLDLLLADGMLQGIYDEYNRWSDTRDFFRVLGLNKPQLRVLEIGAGTGSLTAVVLDALHSDEGERLYGEYMITDVSAGFVNQTKERFAEYQNLKYAVCDITVDPLEQGFEGGSYDLILASNVLHATPNLHETLSRCRSLLKPDGQLYLQEITTETRRADVVFGLFEGWWVGVEDGRVERPLLTEPEWDIKLRQSGFQGIQHAVRDNYHPDLFLISNIVARAASPETELGDILRVTLLKPNETLGQFGEEVKTALQSSGYDVDELTWGSGDMLPVDQLIVSLMDVDVETPMLTDIDSDNLAAFINMAEDISGQVVVWLMRSAQMDCTDPHQGKMLGLARCIRSEMAIDFVTVELDNLSENTSHTVVDILGQVQRAQKTATDAEDSLDIESEYVVQNGQVLVSRFHHLAVDDALNDAAPSIDGKHLALVQPGLLQSLSWIGHRLPSPVPADSVQIKPRFVGLNFHDVAEAMAIMDPEGSTDADGYHGLGGEGTATVTAVGANISHVAVGDRVVFMDVPTGAFATEIQIPAALVAKTPENLSDEDAAALTVPYLTVMWSFLEKAHLKRGQTVLIHSAAGGVGIAAIHIARWVGAEIYVTVGSKEKVRFLVDELGVPRERIFHSRNDSFVADVMRVTNGVGVDVVLNSLSGELLHASWSCVAAEGCMVDLGKRDFLGRGRLAMRPFTDNRAFFGIDLSPLSIHSKHKLVPLMNLMIELLREEKIFPLRPTTVFEADKIQDAFRYMQKGVHRGRIVVRMPSNPAEDNLGLTMPTPKPTFKADAAYLLSGGMGGLGRSVISWMVSHGARHIAVMSPTAGTREEHQEFVKELAERSCLLQCFSGDVADASFVRTVVHNVQETSNRPIKGVLQLAMVLRDAGFVNMDHESWTAAINPKVAGTLNLHNIAPKELDFFVMFGSVAGTLGAYGQANYAAANSFLDSFTRFRHGHGLPASVLDIAAVGDVGYVASNNDVAERLERNLSRFMSEADFLHGLHLVLERSHAKSITPSPATPSKVYTAPSQIILYNEPARPLSDPQTTMAGRRDPRLSIFRNNQTASVETAESGNEKSLRGFLTSLAAEPEKLNDASSAVFLATEIARRIYAFLMNDDVEIDTAQTLSAMGADSLVAIEIRNWWKQALGVDVTVLELTSGTNTLGDLGALAVGRLREKFLVKAA
ncbi:type I polyketide synthase [Aspergillus mulundensis]|uniref:Uncharacterized protein n=1 Tax=Aspergillus mulundensis TaxID=1810919 RepID=A0A3D8SJP1_9EURO|nr:Uncharacterized protein DSM5745_03134 [Aspergillus mulundensis]RDW86492.1 Uncharacterized protein DSM5745_03134 [Aspergillus mulundensis]